MFIISLQIKQQNVQTIIKIRNKSSLQYKDEQQELLNIKYEQVQQLQHFTIKKSEYEYKDYYFNQICEDDSINNQLINNTLVTECLTGYSHLFIFYGQSASGKSLQCFGNEQQQGFIYDLFSQIFNNNQMSQLTEIQIQAVQIYNNNIYDLLNVNQQTLNFINNKLQGQTSYLINNVNELQKILQQIQQQRISAQTQLNKQSSRSHAILTFSIKNKGYSSYLQFAELSGNERQNQAKQSGQQLVEANFINSSLSALSTVLQQISQQAPYISYRSCSLTRVLQQTLQANNYIYLIACINPLSKYYNATVNTLDFAQNVMNIQNTVQANQQSYYEEEIESSESQQQQIDYQNLQQKIYQQEETIQQLKLQLLEQKQLVKQNQRQKQLLYQITDVLLQDQEIKQYIQNKLNEQSLQSTNVFLDQIDNMINDTKIEQFIPYQNKNQ